MPTMNLSITLCSDIDNFTKIVEETIANFTKEVKENTPVTRGRFIFLTKENASVYYHIEIYCGDQHEKLCKGHEGPFGP